MFKIISSPPFDKYSRKLFHQVFGMKETLGLSNASLLYIWSGFLSNTSSTTDNNKILYDISPIELPNLAKFMYSHPWLVAGKKRFLNTRADMYPLYLEFTKLVDSPQLHDAFCKHFNEYAENIMDRGMVEDMIQEACVNETVVLFIKDHFRIQHTNSWVTPVPELSIYFSNLCDYYPNNRFIIVTSLENLHKEINKDNCTIIPMGGDITNQLDRYMQYAPNIDKNPEAKNFISLSRGPRHHRTYLVSGLYGRMLDKYGTASYLSAPVADHLSDAIPYDYLNDSKYEIANIGFGRYIKSEKSLDHIDIYKAHNDNLTNFKESLQSKYNNSIIEFISETSYNELSFNITEKTMHFIYGCNFPIMISSPGVVDFLRNMGIDMFDDIVDHSYDMIEDPAERINRAIDLNLEILTSPNLIKRWKENKYRIEKNINFVKEGKLKDFYSNRFWNTLKGIQL
jgi:hypothetical protein